MPVSLSWRERELVAALDELTRVQAALLKQLEEQQTFRERYDKPVETQFRRAVYLYAQGWRVWEKDILETLLDRRKARRYGLAHPDGSTTEMDEQQVEEALGLNKLTKSLNSTDSTLHYLVLLTGEGSSLNLNTIRPLEGQASCPFCGFAVDSDRAYDHMRGVHPWVDLDRFAQSVNSLVDSLSQTR